MNSSLPIPFIRLPGVSQAFTCTAEFGAVVGAFLPLHVHTWDHPEQNKPFLNQCGVIRLGDLTLLSTWGSAIDGEVEQKSEAQLVLPYLAGTNLFRVGGESFRFRSSCLFVPAARTRIRVQNTACSGIVISFPPESLLPVAHAIAGPGFDGLALRSVLEQPSILSRHFDSRRDRAQSLLMEALAFAERTVATLGEVHPIIRLDDLIRRLIVMLLVPDLLEAVETAEVGEEPFLHASLLEWLLAHLDEPISLSDMEQRSNYSRRSLQFAFKRRFGCGPMQWLRRQRLARARALIEAPGASPSLTEVALACGYLSTASFSRDFLARYGERPSRYWRRLRQTP